jgi:hypothetical protein
VVRMEGTIARGVNFGWGMLAHIYPGGKMVMNQTNAGGNRWIFTDFSMELSVRARLPNAWSDELSGRDPPIVGDAAAKPIEIGSGGDAGFGVERLPANGQGFNAIALYLEATSDGGRHDDLPFGAH